MYTLHDMHTLYRLVKCRCVSTETGMEAELVPLLCHLLTANENLNVSVLSRAGKDKTHCVYPNRQKMYFFSTNANPRS